MTAPLGSEPVPVGGRRLLIAAAVAHHLQASRLDVPSLEGARAEIVDLFTGTFGYTLLPEPAMDPSETDLTRRLRVLCRQRIRPEDHLVVYLSCHGQILENGRHVLVTADADPADEAFLLPTVRLAEALLMDTPVRRLLLVLDTCYSGTGGNQAAAAALAGMERDWSGPGDSGLVVVTAARPFEQARPGAFPRLLANAVNAPSTAGRIPAALDLGAVVAAMNADPARPEHQHIGWAAIGMNGPVPAFLPNPRHRPEEAGLDLRFQQALSWESEADRRDEEFRTRFLPSAKGSPPDGAARADGADAPAPADAPAVVSPDGAWWFTGRHAALGDIARWLASASPTQPALVVTAGPGVGKTALLGLVAALGEPARRRAVPVDGIGLPPEALPPTGVVDVALYAGGLTTQQVRGGIAAALGTAEDDLTGLITALRARLHRTGRPFTLLVDALDEAADPRDLTTRLLRPLLAARAEGSAQPLRMLVGTRPHLLPFLEPGSEQALYGRASDWPSPQVIDLADARYADPDGLLRYTLRCLLGGRRGSPYADASAARTRAVAQAVVHAAAGSFLVARIVAGTLAARDTAADPADARWVRSLPRMAGSAMRADLESRLGADARRAEDLLRPLAHALGRGLPWAGVWAPLAAELSGKPYTDADLEWLQAHAGGYVVESQESGRSVYRLYHQAMADYLRGAKPSAPAAHKAFVEVLSDVPYGVDAARDWSLAHPYALRHLAAHAVVADRLDALVGDAGYLVHAEPETLLPALPHTRTAAGRTARAVYAASAAAHRAAPPARRHRLLALDAARYGATDLARALNAGLAVRPRWATGGMLNPFLHSVVPGTSASVACGEVDGAAVLVTCLGGRVAVLDIASGQAKAVFSGHPVPFGHASSLTVACGTVDGEPVGLSRLPGGDEGDKVLVWDLRTGAPRLSLDGHPRGGFSSAMACATVDGVPVALTAVWDDQVMVWDLRTGSRLRTLWHEGRGGDGIKKLVCTEIDGEPVVVTVPDFGRSGVPARIWEPRTGRLRAELGGGVRAVACAEVDGTPVAVVATADDIVLWDLRTMEEIPSPIVHRMAVEDLACIVVDGVALLVVAESRGFPGAVNDGRISVWELATGRPREMRLPRVGTIRTVLCAQADGIPVAVTSGTPETLVWDLRELPALSEPIDGPTLEIAAVASGTLDGTPVAVTVGGEDWGDGMHAGQVVVWNLRDGRVIVDVRGHGWPVREVALARPAAASLLVLTVGHRNHGFRPEIQVWDSATNTVRDLDGPAATTTLRGMADVGGRLSAVFVGASSEGRQSAVLWDVADDRECGRIDLGGATTAIAPVRGTSVLLTVGRIAPEQEEPVYALVAWDLGTRKRRAEHRLSHGVDVALVDSAVVDGMSSAVVAHRDGRLTVVDLGDGRCTASFDVTGPPAFMACTSSPGHSLAALVTTAERRLIELWDLRTGTLRETFPTPFPVTGLTFAPEGALVVAADREVLVLDVDG